MFRVIGIHVVAVRINLLVRDARTIFSKSQSLTEVCARRANQTGAFGVPMPRLANVLSRAGALGHFSNYGYLTWFSGV